MEKTLLLYTYVDGGINDTPFPNSEDQIEIGAFRYNATRMGAAPTITATVMHPTCLDNVWTSKVYAKFNGEKFYLKQTPTSSFDNEDSRYKHSAEFVSERVILDNVYFYDAVKPGDSNVDDRPVSNSTKFVFYGDIYDFANRLSSSLKFSGLDYTVIVDDGITSEEKLVSFEDTFFSNAIQEAYNTYEVPYYFVGKEIHFGDSNSALPEILKYGVDNQLISITKTNKNLKIVNRITGRGSTENIPYYYPNDSPKGEIKAVASSGLSVKITDAELFSSKINVGEPLIFKKASPTASASSYSKDGKSYTSYSGGYIPISLTNSSPMSMWWSITLNVNGTGDVEIGGEFSVENRSSISFASAVKSATLKNKNGERKLVVSNGKIICSGVSSGTYTLILGCTFSYIGTSSYSIKPTINATGSGSWYLHSGKSTKLSKVGLELVSGTPSNGSTIEQQIGKYVNTSQNLMPSIYRETDGAERFYNAINGEYGDVYFRNPFVEGQPKEHIVNFEDIKPTIKEATNDAGQRIDMFADFAYDEPDSDETYEDTEDNSNVKYKHGYFFAKLRKLPFNLFDHAIENQPMTISFTSGSCGSCKFKIGVTEEYPQRNPVQVDENGNLVRDDQGRVVCGVHGDVKTFQDSQQDTSKGEVWIALMKEDETYGILMPKAPTDTTVGHRPLPCTKNTHDDGDTFVITGIHLPKEYILAAEDKLKDKLIEYMADNNKEKFSFAIKFSRIYFEENQRVLEFLNENSQIDIAYDKDENGEDIVYTQFVKSFSYSMSEGDILPDITVELDENLTVGQNAIQNAISEVRSEIRNVENSVQAAAMMQSRSFINKQTDDTALGEVSFEKGTKFGEDSRVEVREDKTAKLTIDYLEVKKKATFTSLEIQEKTHVGGQLVISPAAMTCNRVEEIEGGYRCYFQTQGEDGEEVFNQFEKDDLAICQTYNSWGSRYYWRKVVNVGDDYIDLSNADGEYDGGSDIPMVGDKIVQLGNVSDTTRQAAQILSAHGDGSPSFVMYNGIDEFSLKDKNITGIIWNPETQEPQMYSYGSFYFGDRKLAGNYITFQKKDGSEKKEVHINARITVGEGSDGLSNLSEWQQAEQDIEDAKNTAQNALDTAQQALEDMSWLDENITEINKRLDGVVENYFYEGAPSMSNVPVSEWMQSETSKEFFNHVGDTYTDIQEYIDDESTPTSGKSWRWCMCSEQDVETVETDTYSLQSSSWTKIGTIPIKDYGSFRIRVTGSYRTYSSNFSYDEDIRVYSGPPTYVRVEKATGDVYVLDENRFIQGQMSVLFYVGAVLVFDDNGLDALLHWHPIADSDAVKALLEASKAQSTADGKSTTYLSKPTNGYKKGDLWILEQEYTLNGVNYTKGELVVAKQTSSSFNASHWEKKVKYTDDTTANAAKASAEAALTQAGEANTAIQELVDTTLPALEDGIITEAEKIAIEKYINIVNTEFAEISSSYATLSENKLIPSANKTELLSRYNALNAAKNTLITYINRVVSGTSGFTKEAVDEAYDAYIVVYSNYKSYVETIYSIIESAIDGKADDAKSDAATAKSAAAAAKQATDDLDNDIKFTVAEKRSIRKMLKDINPSETDSIRIWKWTTTSRTTIYGNQWTKITDESNAEYGWYVSNMHTHSGYTIAKINFTVYERSSIPIYIKSKAEENYDFVLLSGLNIELTSADTEDSTDRVVATTYEIDGQTIVHTFTDVEPGNYFVTIKYKKDGSQSNEPDNGYYKIADGEYAYGSLGDLYRIYQQKGVDDGELDGAWDAAEDLFRYLYSYGDVWKDETTTIPAGFRDNVYSMFQLYYQYITKHQVDISTSDLQYLSRALANGKTITDGGLVMTSLVAVGDTSTSDTSVEAFLNGSSFAQDSTHGKLILASGIPEAASDDNTDLEARAYEATTRIYEDGHIETKDIVATGGEFTNVIVNGSSRSPFVESSSYLDQTEDNHVNISTGEKYFNLSSDISQSGRRMTFVGRVAVLCTNGYIYHDGKSYYNSYIHLGNVWNENNPNTYEIATLIAVKTSNTTVAWVVESRQTYGTSNCSNISENGMFAGLRPMARIISSTGTYQLSEFDHTILVKNNATATLKLPSSPQLGQEYEIIKQYNGVVNINPNGKSVYASGSYNGNNGTGTNTTTIGTGAYVKVKYLYDGTYWMRVASTYV